MRSMGAWWRDAKGGYPLWGGVQGATPPGMKIRRGVLVMEEFLKTAGPVGYVLMAMAVVSVYLSLKNFFYLFFVSRDFQKRFERIEKKEAKYSDELHGESLNPLSNIIGNVLHNHWEHSEDIRAEVAYLLHRNFGRVSRDITLLRLIAVTSPLLGLLGTMLGMVEVFQTIAATASPPTDMLAAGIWEALLTTIMGLIVAIPTLAFYYVLSLIMRGFRIEAVEHSYRALQLFKKNCPAARGQNKIQSTEELSTCMEKGYV